MRDLVLMLASLDCLSAASTKVAVKKDTVNARRNINSNAKKRGEVEEVLIIGKLDIEK